MGFGRFSVFSPQEARVEWGKHQGIVRLHVLREVNVLQARHKIAQADGKTLVWTTHTSHNTASTSQWSGAPTDVLPLDHESRSPFPSE
ncbi:hypothetical protein Taro_026703 [Colocasia esculenta]|uniref:Uncharacterized protein n=1 Tax=Colocasia esculenta TaxID=4460 RepID=A0A843VHX9_COLES|nr:hypothetical protein [Colocasia esculenta]